MSDSEEIDLTNEEIDLTIDENVEIIPKPIGRVNPSWYESDGEYRPFDADAEPEDSEDVQDVQET